MAYKSSNWLYEKRPLRKPKLGPPDLYPQEPKQKEDELTSINVKQGFSTSPAIQNEYGSSRNANIPANKFGAFFSAVIAKKQELNTFQDTMRKKTLVNTKDNMWLVTQRTKNALDSWFRDLCNGSKSLTQMIRKVPFFNKKEEIFVILNEFSVPSAKAIWFIKMSSAYSIAISEAGNKSKKRQLPDQCTEWTQVLCKFTKDLYQKLHDHYHGITTVSNGVPNSSNLLSNSNNILGGSSGFLNNLNYDLLIKSWHYTTQLGYALYEEGLLEKHEYLSWILNLLEKIKSMEDVMLKIILPLIMQYIDEFCQSEYLSRRLCYYASKKLNLLLSDHFSQNNTSHQNNFSFLDSSINNKNKTPEQSFEVENNNSEITDKNSENTQSNPLINAFKDLSSCHHHRYIVLTLSSIIQIVTLKCPTALVWHSVGDNGKFSIFNGSPLDTLPCPPHFLPMPKRPHNNEIRKKIKERENEISLRSVAIEQKWFIKTESNSPGVIMNRLLKVLDELDRHLFDKVDNDNSLESLYNKIFNERIDTNNLNVVDELTLNGSVVKLLCEWAVTTRRYGQHRAFIVSKLLERRQIELQNEKEVENYDLKNINNDSTKSDDKENLKFDTDKSNSLSIPIYQNLLMNFLDYQAPVLDDTLASYTNTENKQLFSNLVLLFGELIRCEVFSHDIYMCTLISRGQFINTPLMNQNLDLDKTVTSTLPLLSGLVSTNNNVHNSSSSVFPSLSSNQESSLPMFDPVSDLSSNNYSGHHNDLDSGKLDADLGKLVQQIKEGQENMDYHGGNFQELDILLPDSVNSDKEDDTGGILSAGLSSLTNNTQVNSMVNNNLNEIPKSLAQRHLLYTIHFPLPQDETTSHDSNQRNVLLYGCGKQRDDAKHQVKKVLKEIAKLFNRKFSMDINEGGKIKKTVIKEGFNFELTLTKFQNLSYSDQNVVIYTSEQACLEMFNGVACKSSNHLPLIESIAFLFDLMEIALSIHDLIEFCSLLLKEMPDIENLLQQQCPLLAGNYIPNVALYVIGVLYKYQNCLLVSTEQTISIFENCSKLILLVEDPEDCTSAERCIISFLYDLYTSHSALRCKLFDHLSSLFTKFKHVMYTSHTPSKNSDELNPNFMADFIANPKLKVEPTIIKQLCESSSFRYSFVCNVMISISNIKDMDKINEVAIFCSELTARCNPLSGEWLGILNALCCTSNKALGYLGAVNSIEIKDLSIHDSIAVFISVLIARNCFSMQDFIFHCALPALLASCQNPSIEAEYGARFTCHLLYCLFKTNESLLSSASAPLGFNSTLYSLTSPGPNTLAGSTTPGSNTPQSYVNSQNNLQSSKKFLIKYPCDRYLLAAARSSNKIETAAILAVMKAILMLSDKIEEKELNITTNKNDLCQKEMTLSDILGSTNDSEFNDFGLGSSLNNRNKNDPNSLENLSLNDFAKFVLKAISSENWVHDRCLKEPKKLIDKEYLLDSMLTNKQAQQLLYIICHPKNNGLNNTFENNLIAETEADLKLQILKILSNLDEWKLGVSVLQLELIYAQVTALQSSIDLTGWLDCIAKAILEFFQQANEEHIKKENQKDNLYKSTGNKNSNFKSFVNLNSKSPSSAKEDIVNIKSKENRVWLISPLIDKLPSNVKGRILKAVAMQLDNGNWIAALGPYSSNSYGSKSKDRGFQQAKSNSNNNFVFSLLNYPPFLSLLLNCINSQEDHKDTLLSALYTQFQTVVMEDIKNKVVIQDGLQLRLSLVGGMFDLIQKSNNLIIEWAVLLLQLMSHGKVEPQLNYLLFTTVLDMLAALIHTTLSTDSNDSREETKKHYQNLMKKLKKEINYERVDIGIKMAKQLLPMPKQQCEVITCEPMGSLIDTKGNKIAGFDSIDKKQGLQVAEKQKVSPWDLIEGHKNPAPLCWSWFGTLKIERKPLRGEENHHLLPWHAHLISKPISHYLQQPLIPTEEDSEMEVEPSSPEKILIVPGNNYDGPIKTILAKNAVTNNDVHTSSVLPLNSMSLGSNNSSNSIGKNMPPSMSNNMSINNNINSVLSSNMPQIPNHLISKSQHNILVSPGITVSSNSLNSNVLNSNSVLSATLQQPSLHSQTHLQQRSPNNSNSSIHHSNMGSLPKMPRVVNSTLNQMLGVSQNQNNSLIDMNSQSLNQPMISLNNSHSNQPMSHQMNSQLIHNNNQIVNNLHSQQSSSLQQSQNINQTSMLHQSINQPIIMNNSVNSEEPLIKREILPIPPPETNRSIAQTKKPKTQRKRKQLKNQQLPLNNQSSVGSIVENQSLRISQNMDYNNYNSLNQQQNNQQQINQPINQQQSNWYQQQNSQNQPLQNSNHQMQQQIINSQVPNSLINQQDLVQQNLQNQQISQQVPINQQNLVNSISQPISRPIMQSSINSNQMVNQRAISQQQQMQHQIQQQNLSNQQIQQNNTIPNQQIINQQGLGSQNLSSQNQQGFYQSNHQQSVPANAPRIMQNSKAALNHMLRAKNPNSLNPQGASMSSSQNSTPVNQQYLYQRDQMGVQQRVIRPQQQINKPPQQIVGNMYNIQQNQHSNQQQMQPNYVQQPPNQQLINSFVPNNMQSMENPQQSSNQQFIQQQNTPMLNQQLRNQSMQSQGQFMPQRTPYVPANNIAMQQQIQNNPQHGSYQMQQQQQQQQQNLRQQNLQQPMMGRQNLVNQQQTNQQQHNIYQQQYG